MLARAPANPLPELELKFQLGDGALSALDVLLPPHTGAVSDLTARYFDTPDQALRASGFSLRVRRNGSRFVQTLKHRGAGGLFERDEWESDVPTFALDPQVLAATPAAAVLGDRQPEILFEVAVSRRVHIWAKDGARIEMSLDLGEVRAGCAREAIAELELERLSGPPDALFHLARDLMNVADLTVLFESKSDRGYALAAGHPARADGMTALELPAVDPAMPPIEAFRAIARSALVHVAGNVRRLDAGGSPEALHQARVGMRRLRSALGVFAPILDREGIETAKTESRWLGQVLAPARDLDVMLAGLGQDGRDEAAFSDDLSARRREAYADVLKSVRSQRYRRLLLDVAEWVEVGSTPDAGVSDRTLPDLAAEALTELDERLRRRSRRFRKLAAEKQHDVRKLAKKLRYAAEFLAELFPEHPKRRKRYLAALKTVQSRLGELNDRIVLEGAHAAWSGSGKTAALPVLGAAQVDAAAKALRDFRRTRAFWKTPQARKQP